MAEKQVLTPVRSSPTLSTTRVVALRGVEGT